MINEMKVQGGKLKETKWGPKEIEGSLLWWHNC